MYIVNFVGSLIVFFLGFGFYLNKLMKIKKNNDIEGKIKLYKHLNITDKSVVVIIVLVLLGILYGITFVSPQPYLFEFILASGALLQGLRAYLEWKYEQKSNRHKISILNSSFLLFLLVFSGLRSVLF